MMSAPSDEIVIGHSPNGVLASRSTTPVPSAFCSYRLEKPVRAELYTIRRPSRVQIGCASSSGSEVRRVSACPSQIQMSLS